MATFSSNLISKRHKHRGIYSGKEYTVEGVIKLSSGTALAAGDILKFVPIGENQVVTQVWAYAIGATDSLEGSIGYAQRVDAAGDPEVVERYGPLADGEGEFTSPATNLTAFADAAAFSTARRVVDTTVEKLAGPVDLAVGVTTAQTLTADVELHVGAVIVGELSDTVVSALYPNAGYEPSQL